MLPVASTFSEFCDLSEQWEKELLSNVVLAFSPQDIINKLSDSPFTACSDGSAITRQGTFGWVIALPDKTRLASGSGPVDGHEPQSFRAEAQGMLSVVCFLARLRQWTGSSAVISGILATDNQV
jgi:hypothetical protein